MINPADLIKNIFQTANYIYQHVQKVKANQAQCALLAERVHVLEQTVKGLETIKNSQQYQAALNDTLSVLTDCLTFIKKFSDSHKWFKYVLKTNQYQRHFANLNNRLQCSLASLNVGLAAQHIFNGEKDRRAQLQDAADIKQRQDEIYQLNKNAYQTLQKFQLDEQEHHQIILRQLASIKNYLAELKIAEASLLDQEKPLLDPKFTLAYFDLTFEQLIASGTLGKVYRGKWHKSNVAIKLIDGTMTEDEYQRFKREIAILTHLRHPQIITFYGASLEKNQHCIVLELAKNNLYHALPMASLAPSQQKQFALNIAHGLAYLHSQSILHRNLTSKHILLTEQGAKITDFGLSKTNYHNIQSAQHASQAIEWQAPECLKVQKNYTAAADIYSYGIILWEIVSAKRPYANIPQHQQIPFILQGGRETFSSATLPFYQLLITACWDQRAEKRPSLEHIINRLENFQSTEIQTGEQLYDTGLRFEREGDYDHAYAHYHQALKAGFYKANTNIGLLFLKGKGVPQHAIDKKEAYQHFLAGANAGHLRAMFNLAKMLKDGDGVPENKNEALSWYQKAAAKAVQEKQMKEYELAQEKIKALNDQLNPKSSYQGFDFSLKK